uniref:Putative secreted protein n=1 Tax=Anopheles darlingi TaxID=43151 RepID=A0A2M4DEE6_ANODA
MVVLWLSVFGSAHFFLFYFFTSESQISHQGPNLKAIGSERRHNHCNSDTHTHRTLILLPNPGPPLAGCVLVCV